MRLSAVAAALLTFNAFVFAAIVTEPTELPWMCTFPVTCSARPARLVAAADMPIPEDRLLCSGVHAGKPHRRRLGISQHTRPRATAKARPSCANPQADSGKPAAHSATAKPTPLR
jgi:hypothetical protein